MTRGGGGRLDRPNPMRLRGFVPLDELILEPPGRTAVPGAPAAPGKTAAPDAAAVPGPEQSARSAPRRVMPDSADDWEKRVSLFGED